MNESVFLRKELQSIQDWYGSKRRKPLILRGARQVGKTTLIQTFAQVNKLDLIEINLELDVNLRKVFSKMNPETILKEVLIYKNTKITKNSLLFIDEIQVSTDAIQSLRYFFELKNKLPVVAAGSLLDFSLSEQNFSMPVGRVDYCFLGPLCFSDFLGAKKEFSLQSYVKNWDVQKKDFLESIHEKLIDLYYDYLIVGGMPQAVQAFVDTDSYSEVQKVQRSIFLTYRNDFAKYAKRIPLERLEKVYTYVPAHIGQKAKYSEISADEQSKQIKLAIDLIEKAQVIFRVKHTSCSGIPLKVLESDKIFKLLHLDVGLVSQALGFDTRYAKELYQNKKSETLLTHRGMITEQFVGQHLLYRDPHSEPCLHYWLRDGRGVNAEVDYVIQEGVHIIPIEVKSGKTGSIKSLIEFVKATKAKKVFKFSLKPPHITQKTVGDHSFTLYEVPLYFIESLTGFSTAKNKNKIS